MKAAAILILVGLILVLVCLIYTMLMKNHDKMMLITVLTLAGLGIISCLVELYMILGISWSLLFVGGPLVAYIGYVTYKFIPVAKKAFSKAEKYER